MKFRNKAKGDPPEMHHNDTWLCFTHLIIQSSNHLGLLITCLGEKAEMVRLLKVLREGLMCMENK